MQNERVSEPLFRRATGPLVGDRRAAALAMLTAAEASRFASDREPEHFLAGRMLLRELAAELSGLPLESIAVTAACPDCGREHGQPRVDGVFVSLSHAGAVTVAAASAEARVGIDIESRDAPPERLAAIRDVAGGDDLAHWTRVEAVLKADGRGLRVDPRAVGIRGDEATLDGGSYKLTDASDEDYVVTVATRI